MRCSIVILLVALRSKGRETNKRGDSFVEHLVNNVVGIALKMWQSHGADLENIVFGKSHCLHDPYGKCNRQTGATPIHRPIGPSRLASRSMEMHRTVDETRTTHLAKRTLSTSRSILRETSSVSASCVPECTPVMEADEYAIMEDETDMDFLAYMEKQQTESMVLSEFMAWENFSSTAEALIDFLLDRYATDRSDAEYDHKPVTWNVSEGSTSEWVDHIVRSLAHNGMCVVHLAEPLLPATACDEIVSASLNRLSNIFELCRARGFDPLRDKMIFNEFAQRDEGNLRFDMRFFSASGYNSKADDETHLREVDQTAKASLPEMPASWNQLREKVEVLARQIFTRTLREGIGADGVNGENEKAMTEGGYDTNANAVRVDTVGIVTSFPGAPSQHFHPDGPTGGLYNIFVPLVPVLVENGPTEVRPYSHRRIDSVLGEVPPWNKYGKRGVAPLLLRPTGDLLIFEYRTWHRGLANMGGQPRPVAYFTFSTCPGVTDENFPQDDSLFSTVQGGIYGSGMDE